MPDSQQQHRITCAVHQHLHGRVTQLLSDMGIEPVMLERGRSVRRERKRRRFHLPGSILRLGDSPANLYQFSVPTDDARPVVSRMTNELELDQPGRGTLFAQQVQEYFSVASETSLEKPGAVPTLLQELALITCILSMQGSGEDLASSALELGTGVPLITLGYGTGMRDRLGLLRITVPPEKELVRLLVPALDAEGIMRLLIEEGRLNRPGKGFVYCTPVAFGRLDTSLQIGYQDHPASIEQIIAAIDDLKANTAWRRRFPSLDMDASFRLQRNNSELTLICPEERSADYLAAAFQAGAGGATVARVRQLKLGSSQGGARERCTLTVANSTRDPVVEALLQTAQSQSESPICLYAQPAPYSFSHRG